MPTAITEAGAGSRAISDETAPGEVSSDKVTNDKATLLGSWRAGRRADLVFHLAHHGAPPLPRRGDREWADRFAATIEASGLTGRGGCVVPVGDQAQARAVGERVSDTGRQRHGR
jgi:hypothetical protein